MIKNKKYVPQTINVKVKDFSKGLNLDEAENICDLGYTVSCYNFDFKSGALVEGLGFEELTLPRTKEYGSKESVFGGTSDFKYYQVWHFKHYNKSVGRLDKVLARTDLGLGYILYVTIFSNHIVQSDIDFLGVSKTERLFTKTVRARNMDALIMSNNTDGTIIWTGESTYAKMPDMPKFVDLCYHKDKLFAIEHGERNYVRYSNKLDVADWTAEYKEDDFKLELNDSRGTINKLISCFGYLFCIRDFGITKLTTYENSDQINTQHVFTSGSKIFENTVCDCGDKVVLLTKDGLFKFTSSSCEKINTNLNELLAKITSVEHTMATFRTGIYYLATKIDFNDNKKIGCENLDNYVNNVLIAFNVNDNTYSITRGIDIIDINTLQAESMDKVGMCFGSEYESYVGQITTGGKFFNNNAHKYWCSPLTDLGYSNKMKYVKNISLLSKYDCTLTVFTEKNQKTFKIKGKDVITKLPVNLRGKQIGVRIEADTAKAYISNMNLEINLTDIKYQ